MKKILGLLVIVLGLTGCSMNVAPTEETYVVEMGTVSAGTANKALVMASNFTGEVTFSDICALRDYLYSNTETNGHVVMRDVTFEELKSMFVQISYTEGQEIANYIKKHGSYINIFYHRNYSYKRIWICVTKTGLLY